MTEQDFFEITKYIGSIIKGTSFDGHVYAVGGSVRDLHMGLPIKDIDLVIDLPHGGVDFANFCKEHELTSTVVTYPTFGTAMFKFHKFPAEEIECVMTRGEKYIDKNSRNPVTSFADIHEDAIRRDLTINALYYNVSTGETLDLVGGLEDIKNKVIRTTNTDPDVVFDDDPLRILRVIRFATRFGWPIEQKTFDSMKKYAERLDIISKERIQVELNKILCSKFAPIGVDMLHETGAMKYVIPEYEELYGLEQNEYHFGDAAAHTRHVLLMHCHKFQAHATVAERVACLLHDIGKSQTLTIKDGKRHFYEHELVGAEMAEGILRRLKYDNDTIKEVVFLIKNHMRTKNAGVGAYLMKDKTLNKLLYECKTLDRFEALMRVIDCDNLSHKEEHCIPLQYEVLTNKVKFDPSHFCMFGYKLPIDGNIIMETLGIEQGREVYDIQQRLLKMAFVNTGITEAECIKMLPRIKKEIESNKKK